MSADLTAAFVRYLPGTFPPGQTGSAFVRVTNVGDAVAAGLGRVDLYASTSSILSPSATLLTSESLNLHLAMKRSKVLKLSYPTPTNLPDAEYFTIADIEAVSFVDANASNNQVASRYVAEIVPPLVDLAAQLKIISRQITLRGATPKATASVSLVVTSADNAPAVGTVGGSIFAATTAIFDESAIFVGSIPSRAIAQKPGRYKTLRVKVILADSLPSDRYYLIAQIAPAGLDDASAANNVAASPNSMRVSNPKFPPRRSSSAAWRATPACCLSDSRASPISS